VKPGGTWLRIASVAPVGALASAAASSSRTDVRSLRPCSSVGTSLLTYTISHDPRSAGLLVNSSLDVFLPITSGRFGSTTSSLPDVIAVILSSSGSNARTRKPLSAAAALEQSPRWVIPT
jgi:hypothetical protein